MSPELRRFLDQFSDYCQQLERNCFYGALSVEWDGGRVVSVDEQRRLKRFTEAARDGNGNDRREAQPPKPVAPQGRVITEGRRA